MLCPWLAVGQRNIFNVELHIQFSNPIAILVTLLARVCQNHNGGCLHVTCVNCVIQCCNLLCVGFTMNSAYGRMACYTCMDHASQDNWPGHPIVCMLGAFNLLQIRRTHKNINSSCLGAAMCSTQEVVSKLGDKMV